jgi:hypothetical protein
MAPLIPWVARRVCLPNRCIHQGLNEIGYVEGQSVAIEYRWADGRLSPLITNLVGRKVSVLAR